MRNVLFALIATAGIAFAGASGANAASANGAAIEKASQNADQTVMVRDGCGRGRHWSRWQNHCVWN
jgi:hypothetical protein